MVKGLWLEHFHGAGCYAEGGGEGSEHGERYLQPDFPVFFHGGLVVWLFCGFGVAALNIVQTLFEHDVKCFVMFVKCLNDVEEQSDDQIKGIQILNSRGNYSSMSSALALAISTSAIISRSFLPG